MADVGHATLVAQVEAHMVRLGARIGIVAAAGRELARLTQALASADAMPDGGMKVAMLKMHTAQLQYLEGTLATLRHTGAPGAFSGVQS